MIKDKAIVYTWHKCKLLTLKVKPTPRGNSNLIYARYRHATMLVYLTNGSTRAAALCLSGCMTRKGVYDLSAIYHSYPMTCQR